jgi:hypothetical protein
MSYGWIAFGLLALALAAGFVYVAVWLIQNPFIK